MSYPCDQIDCVTHPIYIEKEKEKEREKERERARQITPPSTNLTHNDNIYVTSITWETIGKPHSYINIPCIGENIAFECFLCQHLKRQDMKANLIVYNAKNVLSE